MKGLSFADEFYPQETKLFSPVIGRLKCGTRDKEEKSFHSKFLSNLFAISSPKKERRRTFSNEISCNLIFKDSFRPLSFSCHQIFFDTRGGTSLAPGLKIGFENEKKPRLIQDNFMKSSPLCCEPLFIDRKGKQDKNYIYCCYNRRIS